MLEDFCSSLTDRTQLTLALRWCRMALPLWENHFDGHADHERILREVFRDGRSVTGAAEHIDGTFLRSALEAIEAALRDAGPDAEEPRRALRGHGLLNAFLATSMRPLTNSAWDNSLPGPVRLAFTAVWNLLTWLLYREKTENDETHIYVAINQSADALMSGGLYSLEVLNAQLSEYEYERGDTAHPERAPEPAPPFVPGMEPAAARSHEDLAAAYDRLLPRGELRVSDPPNALQQAEVLSQMREKGRSFWDSWAEYHEGISRTYSYNAEQGTFWVTEMDVVAASFFREEPLSESEMLANIGRFSLHALRDEGFEL